MSFSRSKTTSGDYLILGSSINKPIPAVQSINDTAIIPTISFLCSLKNSILLPLIISYYKNRKETICEEKSEEILFFIFCFFIRDYQMFIFFLIIQNIFWESIINRNRSIIIIPVKNILARFYCIRNIFL